MDEESVPLYDRGYALGLVSEDAPENQKSTETTEDASRCFNCSSYNHSMKDCPKPRDNSAVNIARNDKQKQLMSKRKRGGIIVNSTRYYQESPGGKYDGLKPGSLDSETRKLLGIGELEPPPWLNRMRELGYPPGYLIDEDDDKPSGIEIHGDDPSPTGDPNHIHDSTPKMKKESVKFPGINSPIPENADEILWQKRGLPPEPPPRSYRSSHYLEGRSPFTPTRHVVTQNNYYNISGQNSPLNSRMSLGMPRSPADRWQISPDYYYSTPTSPYGSLLPYLPPTRPLSPHGRMFHRYPQNSYSGSSTDMQWERDGHHRHYYSGGRRR